MTIDADILEKIPERFRPIAAKYGPALVAMTAEEFMAWIELLLAGDTRAAMAAVMARMDDPDLVAVGASLTDKWAEANATNAAAVALQKEAAMAILRVLLALALAGVGL